MMHLAQFLACRRHSADIIVIVFCVSIRYCLQYLQPVLRSNQYSSPLSSGSLSFQALCRYFLVLLWVGGAM